MNGINFLTALYDSRKSFYNKAYYIKEDNVIKLFSYNTLVMLYDLSTGMFTEPDHKKSQTTNRHIKEFRKQIENNNIIL